MGVPQGSTSYFNLKTLSPWSCIWLSLQPVFHEGTMGTNLCSFMTFSTTAQNLLLLCSIDMSLAEDLQVKWWDDAQLKVSPPQKILCSVRHNSWCKEPVLVDSSEKLKPKQFFSAQKNLLKIEILHQTTLNPTPNVQTFWGKFCFTKSQSNRSGLMVIKSRNVHATWRNTKYKIKMRLVSRNT